MPQPAVGCDLSRALIDICDLPSAKTDRIVNTPDVIGVWLDTLDHDVRVVFEANSGQDGELIAALSHASIRVRRVSSPEPPARLQRPTGSMPACWRRWARHWTCQPRYRSAPPVCASVIFCQALAEQARLLTAVPGIGPTFLATLLGELPELGTLCRRKIASLADLAPQARESGTWRGARRIWGGRRKIRSDELKEHIRRVHEASFGLYGSRKV